MLTVLRSQSQVTIPDPVISSLGLKEGGQLEIIAENGIIKETWSVCGQSFSPVSEDEANQGGRRAF